MKSVKFILCLLCFPLLLSACKQTPIETKNLSGYFLKNTYQFEGEYACFVFPDQTSMDNDLGIGRTMSNNVDEPDFANNTILAIAVPSTTNSTDIEITKVEKTGDTAVVYFEVKTGEAITYTLQPLVVFSFAKDKDLRTVQFITGGKVVKEESLN